MGDITTIMWFRQDLRLRDNPALTTASQNGNVLAIYIYDEHHPGQHEMGAASKWWLHHSLQKLNQSLNNKLHITKGDPSAILEQLVEQTGAQKVVWNRCYEPWQIARDKDIKSKLKACQIEVQSFNGALLWEPWEIMNQSGSPYKVFTPYYRKGCLRAQSPRPVLSAPPALNLCYQQNSDEEVESLDLMPDIIWYTGFEARWQPGEEGAANNLSRFLNNTVEDYKLARDVPSMKGTSFLSPHLHFGEISAHQAWHATLNQFNGSMDNPGVDSFLSELGWREFSHYLLYHFPTLPVQNFNKKFDNFKWRGENDDLTAWQRGQTGVPMVDAGMRELWQTGYMHNRVRMIVGSYLVKNLGTHWHQGEAWFWDCLLDADLAANSASWQWIAGCGADASPYFRIFNPVTQGEKFDPDGDYIRQYCPELAKLPNRYIHKPWEADQSTLNQAKVILGKTYPHPVVDLKVSRQAALDAYSDAKAAFENT